MQRHYLNLPLSQVEAKSLIHEGIRLKKSENRIYIGEVMNNKKHGKGIAIYK